MFLLRCASNISKIHNRTHTDNKNATAFNAQEFFLREETRKIRDELSPHIFCLNIQRHDSAGGKKSAYLNSTATQHDPSSSLRLKTDGCIRAWPTLRVGCVGMDVPVMKHVSVLTWVGCFRRLKKNEEKKNC